MLYYGIDPGVSGAIAVINDDGMLVDVVRNTETERDVWLWLSEYAKLGEGVAVIEHVHSMPRQGVASSFKFGRSYGFLRGLLIASRISFTEVTPVKWQNAMRCRSKGVKNVTKARAQQLFPEEKITHATADAILLAEYRRHLHAEYCRDLRLASGLPQKFPA